MKGISPAVADAPAVREKFQIRSLFSLAGECNSLGLARIQIRSQLGDSGQVGWLADSDEWHLAEIDRGTAVPRSPKFLVNRAGNQYLAKQPVQQWQRVDER